MIACPSCHRRVFTRQDMFYATLHGTRRCRWCSRTVRLDVLSRWMLSCMLAILLPNALLYGNVFYSGHLFLISLFLIYSGLGLLSFVGFRFLTLEVVPDTSALDRRQSMLLVGIVLIAAIVMDGFIASRLDAENARENERAPQAVQRQSDVRESGAGDGRI